MVEQNGFLGCIIDDSPHAKNGPCLPGAMPMARSMPRLVAARRASCVGMMRVAYMHVGHLVFCFKNSSTRKAVIFLVCVI